ncbi:Putative SKP1/BTB/POZ domain superfamily protein [Septoria linicola]|uniref:SKP1/BTB/POZ domain superfamily protein n=1 Tax=Septoria linicola TaxID=215465 RepID=A0A9Q9EMQ2_9PEZI|nr:Putative SKP1/BTB/POZ domain superfamily protein [Septoria linicola]
MSGHQAIDIDPCGDVVFVFEGADENSSTRMRVDSVALSFGSPVFKKMLGPDFKEGQQLSATTPVEIPLDDDAESMEIACRALHHQNHSLSAYRPSSMILEVAKLLDKYDCAEALALLADSWLKDFVQYSEFSLGELLMSAYLFRRHQLFESIADHILEKTTGRSRILEGSSTLSDVSERLITAILSRRSKVNNDICDFVEGHIGQVFGLYGEYANMTRSVLAVAMQEYCTRTRSSGRCLITACGQDADTLCAQLSDY